MSKEHFNQLMRQYSSEAEGQRAEEVRDSKRAARRGKIRQALLGVLFLAACAYLCMNNQEIRDAYAKHFPSKEPEYQEILKLADEVRDQNAARSGESAPPTDRNSRLKQALQAAQNHAAVVDGVMDSTAPPPKKKQK